MAWTPLPPTVTLTFETPTPHPFVLDPKKTAMVVVDVQELSVRGDSDSKKRMHSILEGNIRLLEKFRAVGAPVIYIQSTRTPESLEVARFGMTLWRPDGTPEVEIAHEIAPLPTEPVVKKGNHDPFVGTNLDSLLADYQMDPTDWTVLVTGISAAGCAYVCALGFSNRKYLTLIPMDATAAGSAEDEAFAYAKYQGQGYAYNMDFTLSTLVSFEEGAEAPELQMRRMRERDAVAV